MQETERISCNWQAQPMSSEPYGGWGSIWGRNKLGCLRKRCGSSADFD